MNLLQRFRSTPRRLAVASAATAAAAVAGSLATDVDSRWYRRRDLPAWQPPGVAFPIVWTALYADIAATSAATTTSLDDQGRFEEARSYWAALGVNLALNAGWCALFFRARRPSLATAGALALAVSSADLARRAAAVDPAHGAALAPYAAWCTFATALSAEIWRRNGDG
ncbi:tryptophan-rich sensory protein [Cellulomonas sp. JH27-2]|uniref:TspO/MBR family protein n=1 Tax=Cellulomonas sp. JH27-2 TaxID=2774139 RepID=UPI00177FB7E5|nr:TspO/MBR family protein [Cellulomonas sp. JH27-2]MBD8058174.1 tryptophan-rich sensory protein [Cellulomonas sp. JH27-2]